VTQPLILLTNDDGIASPGLAAAQKLCSTWRAADHSPSDSTDGMDVQPHSLPAAPSPRDGASPRP